MRRCSSLLRLHGLSDREEQQVREELFWTWLVLGYSPDEELAGWLYNRLVRTYVFVQPAMGTSGLRFLASPGGAVWLSALFGIANRQLRFCRCGRLFIAPPPATRQRSCPRCSRPQDMSEGWATQLPVAARKPWRRAKHRLWAFYLRPEKTKTMARSELSAAREEFGKRCKEILATLRRFTRGLQGEALRKAVRTWELQCVPILPRGRRPKAAS